MIIHRHRGEVDKRRRDAAVPGAHDEREHHKGIVQAVGAIQGDAPRNDGSERLRDPILLESDDLRSSSIRLGRSENRVKPTWFWICAQQSAGAYGPAAVPAYLESNEMEL